MIYLEQILLNLPTLHVNVYGCGGTGSFMIEKLGAIAYAFRHTMNREIFVTAYDYDTVSERNVARSNFILGDVGIDKTMIAVSTANLRYGLNWECKNPSKEKFGYAHIHFICVDTMKDRVQYIKDIKNHYKSGYADAERKSYYIFDIGNDRDFGQVILLDTAGKLLDINRKGNTSETIGTPSCGTEGIFQQQGLFVNQFMALTAAEMFWQLISKYQLDYNQVFINLSLMRIVSQLKMKTNERSTARNKSKSPRHIS